jgi:hypothetical protein
MASFEMISTLDSAYAEETAATSCPCKKKNVRMRLNMGEFG